MERVFQLQKALNATVVDDFAYGGPEQEPVGLICEIDETSTEALQKTSKTTLPDSLHRLRR